MSSISQTKVPLVNIFFGNMIRLNKFPSWLSQNWIFFESPNDRTTCPVIHGFARTMLDSDQTLSVDRPLFQALPLVSVLTGLYRSCLKSMIVMLCTSQKILFPCTSNSCILSIESWKSTASGCSVSKVINKAEFWQVSNFQGSNSVN